MIKERIVLLWLCTSLVVIAVVIGFVVIYDVQHPFWTEQDKEAEAELLDAWHELANIVEYESYGYVPWFDDLTLTIYHTSLTAEHEPWSVDQLIEYVNGHINGEEESTYRVDVTGDELRKNIRAMISMTENDCFFLRLGSMGKASIIDARIYFEFKYKGETLFNVAFWDYASKKDMKASEGLQARVLFNQYITMDYNKGHAQDNNRGIYYLITPYLKEKDRCTLEDYLYGRYPKSDE